MGLGDHYLQNLYSEDPLAPVISGRPTRHQHFAIHPKPTDPWYVRWAATRDAFWQHDWETRFFLSYVIKGAVLGTMFGGAYYALGRGFNPLEINKMILFANKQGALGPALVASKLLFRYSGIGAIGGTAYFFWHYLFCTTRGHNDSASTYMFSNGVFFGVAAACLNPRRAGHGVLMGISIGLMQHTQMFGNNELGAPSVKGQEYQLAALSEQERQQIQERDRISDLSRHPSFKYGQYTKVGI